MCSLAGKHSVSVWTIRNVLVKSDVPINSARRNPHNKMTQAEIKRARELYASGLSSAEVGKHLGRSDAVLSVLKRHYPEIVRPKIGPGSPHWKGGRSKARHGYIYVWIAPDDPMACMAYRGTTPYVLEHRLVMARKIGRALLPTETVHHINGIRTDNRPENLELRQGKHGKHIVMCCLDCGSHNIGHGSLK